MSIAKNIALKSKATEKTHKNQKKENTKKKTTPNNNKHEEEHP